jgi:hypothetical protein
VDEFLKTLSEMDRAAQVKLDYDKTLALLVALKTGAVQLEDVTLTDGGWSVTATTEPTDEAPESEQ